MRLWYQMLAALLVLAVGIAYLVTAAVPAILGIAQVVAGTWLAAAVDWTMLRRPHETS